jgi:periplasmic divalent cation tolerance protein
MSDIETCVVMTTVPSREHAETIARAVLEARLAACVHIHAVASLYWWDDRITAGAEQQLAFKTTARNYADLEAAIVRLHPYDTPEIIRLPIERGLSKYLAWIDRETA